MISLGVWVALSPHFWLELPRNLKSVVTRLGRTQGRSRQMWFPAHRGPACSSCLAIFMAPEIQDNQPLMCGCNGHCVQCSHLVLDRRGTWPGRKHIKWLSNEHYSWSVLTICKDEELDSLIKATIAVIPHAHRSLTGRTVRQKTV